MAEPSESERRHLALWRALDEQRKRIQYLENLFKDHEQIRRDVTMLNLWKKRTEESHKFDFEWFSI